MIPPIRPTLGTHLGVDVPAADATGTNPYPYQPPRPTAGPWTGASWRSDLWQRIAHPTQGTPWERVLTPFLAASQMAFPEEEAPLKAAASLAEHLGSTGEVASSAISDVARTYRENAGLTHEPLPPLTAVDEGAHRAFARTYEQTPSTPNDPKTIQTYRKFVDATNDQAAFLKSRGYTMDVVPRDAYPDAAAMHRDIRENKHLSVTATAGDQANPHPLMTDEENDTFRWVHDIMGHGPGELDFTLPSEEQAYRNHAALYPPVTHGALAAETRGQTSTYFFGSKPGTFVEQKAMAFPEHLTGDYPGVRLGEDAARIVPHLDAGATLDAKTLAPTTRSGYAVADPSMTLTIPKSADAASAVREWYARPNVQDRLQSPGAHIGTWTNPKTGVREVNISHVLDQEDQARSLGRLWKQESIGHLGEGGTYLGDIPLAEQRQIAGPALRIGGKTYDGAFPESHIHPLNRAQEDFFARDRAAGVPERQVGDSYYKALAAAKPEDEGFTLTNGDYVDREEGYKIADANGQLIPGRMERTRGAPGELHSADVHEPAPQRSTLGHALVGPVRPITPLAKIEPFADAERIPEHFLLTRHVQQTTPMQTVLRIEHPETGLGPYGNRMGNAVYQYGKGGNAAADLYTGRQPNAGFEIPEGHQFGFASRKQYEDWFSALARAALEKGGYKLTPYRVPLSAIKADRYQLSFDPKNAQRLGAIPPTFQPPSILGASKNVGERMRQFGLPLEDITPTGHSLAHYLADAPDQASWMAKLQSAEPGIAPLLNTWPEVADRVYKAANAHLNFVKNLTPFEDLRPLAASGSEIGPWYRGLMPTLKAAGVPDQEADMLNRFGAILSEQQSPKEEMRLALKAWDQHLHGEPLTAGSIGTTEARASKLREQASAVPPFEEDAPLPPNASTTSEWGRGEAFKTADYYLLRRGHEAESTALDRHIIRAYGADPDRITSPQMHVLKARVLADARQAGMSGGEWQARVWGGQTGYKSGFGQAGATPEDWLAHHLSDFPRLTKRYPGLADLGEQGKYAREAAAAEEEVQKTPPAKARGLLNLGESSRPRRGLIGGR